MRPSVQCRTVFGCASVLCLYIGLTTQAGIIHRYSFNDGSARDSVGKVDGQLKGSGASIADGKLVLKNDPAGGGGDKVSYLEFSGSVLPTGTSATFIFWFAAKDVGQY